MENHIEKFNALYKQVKEEINNSLKEYNESLVKDKTRLFKRKLRISKKSKF